MPTNLIAMNRLTTLTLAMLAVCFVSTAQTIRIANNNPGAPDGVNVYHDLQEAIDSADSGDIIHVIPSSINYGSIVIDKSVSLVGVGLIPNKDIGTRSSLTTIQMSPGAQDIRLAGLDFTGNLSSTSNVFTVTNLIVENCRLLDVNWSGSTTLANFIMRNNIFKNGAYIEALNGSSGVILSNNIIYLANQGLGLNGATLEHNLFVADGGHLLQNNVAGMHNCNFRKNIFVGIAVNSGNTTSATGNHFEDNLSTSTDTVFTTEDNGNTQTGNIVQTPAQLTLIEEAETWSDSFDPTPLATSPVIVDAADRTQDIGPSGGITPFNLEGTDLPLIESITAPAVIKKGDNLEVRIQASGN